MKKAPPLFKHQEEASNFILARGGSGALFHEMGLGKTRTAIHILMKLRESEPNLRMLVFAPLSLLEAAWAEDVKTFSNFSFWNLRNGFGIEGRKIEDIYAINYEFLLSKEKIGRLGKMIKAMSEGGHPWMIVLDESSRIKNAKSQTTKMLLAFGLLFKYRMIMSGTPAPNSEMEYWPQIQFVDPGCLGTSMTAFRNQFFHLQNRYTGSIFAGGYPSAEVFRKHDYRITDEKRRQLMEKIAPLCHVAKKKDCLDLPEQIDEVRSIELSPAQEIAYRDMERHLVAEIRGEQIAAPVALTKLMKLRQITSGFIYNAVGESLDIGKPVIKDELITRLEFENPKLKELLDVIEEAGPQPMIIWINFHWEHIKICHELFTRFGENSVVTLSALTKDRDESIRAFKEGKARFLVAHPASAAHGLTFVNCSLQIFFSIDYSLERYEQARARTHRAGQKNPCTYIHLLAKDTIDEKILNVLKKKGTAQDIVYQFLSKYAK